MMVFGGAWSILGACTRTWNITTDQTAACSCDASYDQRLVLTMGMLSPKLSFDRDIDWRRLALGSTSLIG